MDDAPVPYVWLAPAEGGAYAPSRAESELDGRLRAWAAARHVDIRQTPAPPEPLSDDTASGDAVEAELARARDALAAADATSVDAALGRADELLNAHPELLHAAWLRAEVERSRANRHARLEPKDDARAQRAWRYATSLDGGRTRGLGETVQGDAEPVSVEVRVTATADVEFIVDGRTLSRARSTAALEVVGAGEHHFLARRAGKTIWAAWLAPKEGLIQLPDLSEPACSRGDFARVRIQGGRIVASGVRCERWFAVRLDEAIAQCRGGACGVFLALKAAPSGPAPREAERPGAPTWLTWAAIGLGAALTAGSLVYATGAFDKPAHETRFVSGGIVVR